MTPDVDERLASVIRALGDVVLPSLPPEAGLAQEQVQLAIGHLRILRGQIDGMAAFERDELAAARALATELLAIGPGDATLAGALADGSDAVSPADVRAGRRAIHAAIDRFVAVMPADPRLDDAIIRAEEARSTRHRILFAPFGFDVAPPAG